MSTADMWTFVDVDDGSLMLDVICIFVSIALIRVAHAVISKFHLVDISSLCTLRSFYAHSYHIWRKDIPDPRKTHSGSTLFSVNDLGTISSRSEMSVLRWYGRGTWIWLYTEPARCIPVEHSSWL